MAWDWMCGCGRGLLLGSAATHLAPSMALFALVITSLARVRTSETAWPTRSFTCPAFSRRLLLSFPLSFSLTLGNLDFSALLMCSSLSWKDAKN